MPESRFFELVDDHPSMSADGNPEPLVEVAVNVDIPTMVGEEVVSISHGLTIDQAPNMKDRVARVIPGTRVIETTDHLAAVAVLGLRFNGDNPQFTEVGKPKLKDERDKTQDAVDEAGTHDDGQEG